MSLLRFQPMLESRPIREIAYEMLKHAIITGEIPAGERIVETDYAERLHISRTPLREALRKLERDGLVEYVMRRGVVVRAFTIADVEEIYTIRNALEMLTLVRIPSPERRLQAYPHEMSGGMRQRAMIALALSSKPRILLADEPTTALDATVQVQVLLLLRELQRELGLSMIFVTHDISVAV